jgi:outer membrane protein OmpA-like peptidoglycan-associated protein
MNGSLLSSRWFRISTVILIIFLGVLIGLPYLIKQQARTWLEDNGGDRVDIRDVDFNPFAAELVLDDLLVEVEGEQPLHFDTARLELEWLPLLQKRIAVQAIELQGFYMLVNNEDILRIGGILVPPGESEPETPEPAGEPSAWLAGIRTLALKDFTLVYHDAALDQRVYIDSLELSELRQWDPEAPARLTYRGAVNDAAVKLEAELAPFAQTPSYKGTVAVEKLSLTDFEPLAKPALAKLAGLVSVHGDFEVEQNGDDIHVLNEGELKLEDVAIEQEQVALTNQSLGWDGSTDLTINTASSQVSVKTKGRLDVQDTSAQHALVNLTNQSLGWDGATDLNLNTASSQTSVKSEGKLTSTGLATDLQEQNLKFGYQNLDLDGVFSYADSDSGADIALNSDLHVSGLDLLAPEEKVDILSAQKLQLAGLEIKGAEHVSVKTITADELDLGRSLSEQETAPEDEKRAIFHASQVSISSFSHIEGFTAIDKITEDDVHVVYHRDKQGQWNAVTLLNALAGEQTDAGKAEDPESGKKAPDAKGGAGAEKVAEQSSGSGKPQAAAGPAPLAVNRVDVSKGSTATIFDESVTPAFKTTLTVDELFLENLDGRKPEQNTTFKLDAHIGKHATLNAGGDIKPYLRPPAMNIQGKLAAIELPPLSPYTTDSMGVTIDSGSLDVDLKLASQDELMKGEAVLLMHHLSVKGTDSKDGLQSRIPVPLDMALNILRDKNDTIELKIPVEGDANNPQFDVSDAITKAVATGVSAGATSYLVYALQPYGAMIAVAKVAGEAASKIRLDPVQFEPGQASLDDNDRDYLSKIAKVLNERPQIAVKVCGVAVKQDVAHLQPPAQPQAGKGGTETAKKETPPATPVVDAQKLAELGEQRAASVKDYLVDKFKVPANRLVSCQPRLETDQADAVPRTDLLL